MGMSIMIMKEAAERIDFYMTGNQEYGKVMHAYSPKGIFDALSESPGMAPVACGGDVDIPLYRIRFNPEVVEMSLLYDADQGSAVVESKFVGDVEEVSLYDEDWIWDSLCLTCGLENIITSGGFRMLMRRIGKDGNDIMESPGTKRIIQLVNQAKCGENFPYILGLIYSMCRKECLSDVAEKLEDCLLACIGTPEDRNAAVWFMEPLVSVSDDGIMKPFMKAVGKVVIGNRPYDKYKKDIEVIACMNDAMEPQRKYLASLMDKRDRAWLFGKTGWDYAKFATPDEMNDLDFLMTILISWKTNGSGGYCNEVTEYIRDAMHSIWKRNSDGDTLPTFENVLERIKHR